MNRKFSSLKTRIKCFSIFPNSAGVLYNIVQESHTLNQIHKSSLKTGDTVILKTDNSVYLIKVMEKEKYTVSGGWFDKTYSSPLTTTINGCTWGSNIIKNDIIAACGLHLEFGNKVVTSRIKKIFHISSVRDN